MDVQQVQRQSWGANYTANLLFNLNIPVTLSVSLTGTPFTGLQTYYIHSDHLDSPRSITNTAGQEVWRWDNTDPFGNNIANENPANLGAFTFNLRFPGQYFDRETGLHYNVNRDYNPAIGRYVESDPIGLQGGINTFGYVGGNPLSYTDPLGLAPCGAVNRSKCEAFCGARNSQVLVCEEARWNIWVASGDTSSCTCTNDEKWGGYREGKPDIPDNCTKVRRDVRNINSQDFKDFLDKHDISKKGWNKVMETYRTPSGNLIERHFWEEPSGRSFYHL